MLYGFVYSLIFQIALQLSISFQAGYQITQQFKPLASGGHINFVVHGRENTDSPYECSSQLKQLQLEQDSGRSFHVSEKKSLVDLNRAGIILFIYFYLISNIQESISYWNSFLQ